MSISNAAPTASQAGFIDGFRRMMGPIKNPPTSPYAKELANLSNSGAGDLDYEREQLMERYRTGSGKAEMDAFYAANPEWYNADGSTNTNRFTPVEKAADEWHKNGNIGPNPVTAAMREFDPDIPNPVGAGRAGSAASEAGNGGTLGTGNPFNNPQPTATPTPTPTPTPAPVAQTPVLRPSILDQAQTGGATAPQQQQIAAALREPSERFAPKPQQNSSWQAGGWG